MVVVAFQSWITVCGLALLLTQMHLVTPWTLTLLSRLKKTARPLTIGSSPIPCHQLVSAPIQVEGREPIQVDFLVVPGNSPPMLEYKKLFSKYPGRSDGIGCLKNTQVTLHIDKTVPPVARKHDRTPFHMRTKVAAEIQKLEQEGIIEKVSGPTEWVSRTVTPPKPRVQMKYDSALTCETRIVPSWQRDTSHQLSMSSQQTSMVRVSSASST